MNFTQSFEEFSAGLGPMDLALYAGVGIVIWVLFKDQLTFSECLIGHFTILLTFQRTLNNPSLFN